jgi:hypothetical protein
VASLGAKIVMYVCYAFIFANLFLGILNEYCDRELGRYDPEEQKRLVDYAFSITNELPPNMEILLKTDSLIIVGKPAKRVNGIGLSSSNIIMPDSLKNPLSLYFGFMRSKLIPTDFQTYYSLITNEEIDAWATIKQFYDWVYPEYMIFAYVPNLPSNDYVKDREIQLPFFYLRAYEYYKQDGVIDFIWELFNGKLKERYTLFFGKFKELFFPTYVSAEMKDDPYFLIYQGKYEEAREGLNDLPQARRAFCEKKLEALGY